MSNKTTRAVALTLALAVAAPATSQPFDVGQAAFERHTAKALEGVPEPLKPRIRELCTGPADPYTNAPGKPYRGPATRDDPAKTAVAPAKVFDNLYFVGDRNVSVWALDTSEGLILFDAHHDYLVEDRVIGGLTRLGLDPARIRYVVVTHGHDDHYGGALLLQQRYKARVLMGAADWKAKGGTTLRGFREPMPKRDIAAGDQTLRLGDTAVKLVATPGHTPGTISAIFAVRDGETTHVVGLWGGGFPHESVTAMKAFALSAEKFAKLSAEAGVDVTISNHPRNDESLLKLAGLARRTPGGRNPFVVGQDAARQRTVVLSECARAYVALKGG